MIFTLSFKQMASSEKLRDYAQEKSEKLTAYFQGRVHVTWILSSTKLARGAHLHLVGNHMDYFAEVETEDFTKSIDQVLEKVERQIRKHKEIVKDHLHRAAAGGRAVKIAG